MPLLLETYPSEIETRLDRTAAVGVGRLLLGSDLGDPMLVPMMKLTFDTVLLAMEAQTVIGMRLSQIAMGRGTAAETQLMVTEKVLAFVEAATTVATGGSPQRVVSGYLKHVRANVQRLKR